MKIELFAGWRPSRLLRDLPFALGLLVISLVAAAAVMAQTGTPAIIAGPTVGAITETTAVISWQTDRVATTIVEFGPTASLGETYRKIVPMEETEIFESSHAMTLSELRPDTVYHYRVRSAADDGAAVESPVLTFSTKAKIVSLKGVRLEPVLTVEFGKPSEFRAAVDGQASDLTFVWRDFSGGPSQTQAGAVDAQGIWHSQANLAVGDYQASASARGFDESGQAWTVESAHVSFRVLPKPQPTTEQPSLSDESIVKKSDLPTPPTVVPSKPSEPMTAPQPIIAPAVDSAVVATEVVPPTAIIGHDAYVSGVAAGSGTEQLKDQARQVVASLVEVVTAVTAANAVSGNDVCAASGIAPNDCASWLRVRFGSRACVENGIAGREACREKLMADNGGVFPGCEGRSEPDCAVVMDLTLMGYVPEALLREVDGLVTAAQAEGVVVALPEVMPIVPAVAMRSSWYPAATQEGAAPAVIMPDADQDGLPDGLEIRLGTDPQLGDSDGDGTDDAREIVFGRNPVGDGNFNLNLDPVELALLERRPIEQPHRVGIVDENLTVTILPTAGGLTLAGRCPQRSSCLVYLYSYVPLVLTVTADDNGNWLYELGDSVADGDHAVYVALTDDTGRIERKSNPLSLLVREAQAITVADFLQPSATTAAAGPVAAYQRYYLAGAAVLMLLAGGIVFTLLRRARQRPVA